MRLIMAWYCGCVIRRLRQLVRKPMFSEMDMPLSFSTTTIFSGFRCTMLFSASKLEPEVIAPSPTTAIVHESDLRFSAVCAMPSAMDSPVPACPAQSVSCGLSIGSPKPDSPPASRMSLNSSRRPVTSLCV